MKPYLVAAVFLFSGISQADTYTCSARTCGFLRPVMTFNGLEVQLDSNDDVPDGHGHSAKEALKDLESNCRSTVGPAAVPIIHFKAIEDSATGFLLRNARIYKVSKGDCSRD